MPTKSTATSEDVSETLESCNSFSFREIDFTSLPIDDLVELYDVMRLLFYCPHGDFLEGESFLQYFSPNNADSERYLERLRTWLQKQSLCSVDFDSSDLKEDVLKMRKNLYKWTKIAKRCFVSRSTKDSSGGTGELLPSRDNADRNDILSTKELITLAMECRQKQRADSSIPTEAEDDTAIPTRTSSRKRKRNQKNIPLTSHYFDEELSLLKPLLIFDLNKVLVWRRKKSMCFVIRPHAMEFVTEMAKHYTVAVWTATMAYNARKIVHDLFTSQGIPLLFTWYNDMCVAHDGLGRTIYSCAAAAGVAAAAAAWKKPNKDSNQKEQDSLIDLSRSLSDPQSLPFPPFVPSSLPSTRDNCVPKEDNGIVSRTIMMKPLTLVWSSYPTYSELNTILIDDSREKCSENNYYNCVHPLPYLNPHTRNDSDDCVENSIYGAQSRDISSEDIVANGEAESVEIPDNELEPAGRLWSYLTSISSSFKDGEPSVKFGSDIRNDDEELSGMNNIAEDLSDGCEIRKDNKSLSVVSLAALVKAKGQYICRVA